MSAWHPAPEQFSAPLPKKVAASCKDCFFSSIVQARFTRSGEDQKLCSPGFVLFPIFPQSWCMVDVEVLSISSFFPGREVTKHSGSICVFRLYVCFAVFAVLQYLDSHQTLDVIGIAGHRLPEESVQTILPLRGGMASRDSNLKQIKTGIKSTYPDVLHSLGTFLFCQEETPLLDSCA